VTSNPKREGRRGCSRKGSRCGTTENKFLTRKSSGTEERKRTYDENRYETNAFLIFELLQEKGSGGHQAKRRKEEKTQARGTGRHATAAKTNAFSFIIDTVGRVQGALQCIV
jgi:hypothetical protein